MPRPRPAAPLAAAPGRRASSRDAGGRGAGARTLALALAVTLAPGAARAHEPGAAGSDLSEQTAEVTAGAAPGPAAETPPQLSPGTGPRVSADAVVPMAGAEQATRWTAEGQSRRTAGDLDGAIAAWQRAIAALPVTQATAHRRAGLALAIATAHADAARARPERLLQAIAVLDAYLAGLDPTDDENRVAVEQRRAELASRLAPTPAVTVDGQPEPAPAPRDRRLLVAGGVGLGLGAVGLSVLGAGLIVGSGADRDLVAAVALPGDDPRRASQVTSATGRGLTANRLAIAGGIVGGVLLLAGVALTIAGVVRRPPRRAALVPRFTASGLRWQF